MVELRATQRRAQRVLALGLLGTGIAIVLSVVSFLATKPGGIFVVGIGAIATGLAIVGRSVSTLYRIEDAMKENAGPTHSN